MKWWNSISNNGYVSCRNLQVSGHGGLFIPQSTSEKDNLPNLPTFCRLALRVETYRRYYCLIAFDYSYLMCCPVQTWVNSRISIQNNFPFSASKLLLPNLRRTTMQPESLSVNQKQWRENCTILEFLNWPESGPESVCALKKTKESELQALFWK